MSEHLTETQTRLRIDRQLEQAGWSAEHRNLMEEFLLADSPPEAKDRSLEYSTSNQFADYVLLGKDKLPLAAVEAKRSSRAPRRSGFMK